MRRARPITCNSFPTALIAGIPVNTALPASSLFSTHPGSTARYLIETDPRFAGYRSWLSSDWMLAQLGIDPAAMHKRLGDGFYEQRLLTEQVAALTG
ncbi:MAG: S-layer family protein, partial [Sterolibacterium sp.]